MRALGFVAVALSGLLAACSSSSTAPSDPSQNSALKNLLLYGGTTVPPSMKLPYATGMDCPAVTIPLGGAEIRNGGDGLATASQFSIVDLARECVADGQGGVNIRTGVEGNVLLGSAGRAGNYSVPLKWTLMRGNEVALERNVVVPVQIAAGQTRADFRYIIEGVTIKSDPANDYTIYVTLGKGGSAHAQKSKKRKKQSR